MARIPARFITCNILVIIVLLTTSCSKTEGEGGRTKISGTVYYNQFDQDGNFIGREEARNEDVFLIYGDNSYFSDDLSSGADGTYEFNYLQKGSYTLFGYSDCPTCDSGVDPTEVTVELSGKNETVTAPDLELNQVLAPDDGSNTITGRLKVMQYNTTGELVAQYYGPDYDVFIQYAEQTTPFERVKSSPDGYFSFRNLITGSFTVYAFSDCDNCTSGVVSVELTTTITGKGENTDLGDLVVDLR